MRGFPCIAPEALVARFAMRLRAGLLGGLLGLLLAAGSGRRAAMVLAIDRQSRGSDVRPGCRLPRRR